MAGRWREGSTGEHAGVCRTSSRDLSRDPKKNGSPSRDAKRKESKLDFAFEFDRTWGAEKMALTIRDMLAEQTKQLQACVAEEVQKVQRLLAEHTEQLTGCVAKEGQRQTRQLQGSPAAQGGLEELLKQEMEEMRREQAGLREMIHQNGGAVSRIEALFQPVPTLPSTSREGSKMAPSYLSGGIAEEAEGGIAEERRAIQTGRGPRQVSWEFDDHEAQRARVAPQSRPEEPHEQEWRTAEAGLSEMIEQHGVALARIEACVLKQHGAALAASTAEASVLKQHGAALARIESSFQSLGGANMPGTPPGTPRDDEFPPVLPTVTGGTDQGGPLVDLITTDSHMDRGRSIRRYCRAICHSRRFVVLTACVIAANSIYLGLEANAIMTTSGYTLPDDAIWRYGNDVFALVFLVELTLRWVADGATFLLPRNPEFIWNWLDTLLIGVIVAEAVLKYFSVDIPAFGVLRLTRLLRLTWMMRAFKVVRELKELKIMVTGLLNCVRPLFWAGLLLLSLTYMMGVIIAQLLTEYLRSVQDTVHDEETTHAMNYIALHFSNLWESMYSLFEALTGGRDWGDIARPFRQIHWVLVCCLVLYIVVGIFCILNMLTAVFLEAAHRLDDVQELVYAKKDWVKNTRAFFVKAMNQGPIASTSITASGKPEITRDTFIDLLGTRKVVKFLEENGVDLFFMTRGRLKELFSIMDNDNNGTLDVDEFVACLYSLKGPARALDLKLEHQRMSHLISSLPKHLAATVSSSPQRSRASSPTRPRRELLPCA